MRPLEPGQKIRYLPQPGWGVGHVLTLSDEGRRADVRFPEPTGTVRISLKGGKVEPHFFEPGDEVLLDGLPAQILERIDDLGDYDDLATYRCLTEAGEIEISEDRIEAPAPPEDLLDALRAGRVGRASAFVLRRESLALDDERRADALGALFASRVMVRPHQVGVVQRVLSAPRPRFVLGDEVGLGKTIEAGMIYSALRLSGMARRVLVVAPGHLTVQWLVELFHKFNQLFTFMDADRYRQSLEEAPEVSPWERFDQVVTSLELLTRGEGHFEALADTEWDLVILDEAHHLSGPKARAVAERLAEKSFGLLLLTATPMQLDPEGYRRLLALVDPDAAPTKKAFADRMKRQGEVAAAARALLEGTDAAGALEALRGAFPDDPVLAGKAKPQALLAHLASTYSLSDRLVRNRRAVVGGFPERRVHRHRVALDPAEAEARAKVVARLDESGVRGAALAGMLRRLESSPSALKAAVASNQALADLEIDLPDRDGRYLALRALLEDDPSAKVLVFTEARATLDFLQAELGRDGIAALAYHGDLALVERDRQVARFRDPEGPRVLLSTDLGGEGRNFQFAHHLVNYDLPWRPAAVEQRIGRLDRVGRTTPVDIHVFEVPGTLSAEVLELLDDAVDVFRRPIGGLDPVLEEVEPRLLELALVGPAERAAYAKTLKKKVARARTQVGRDYDPLLDLRSYDREDVAALVDRALKRHDLDETFADATVEERLVGLARDLDERLEETVTELAERVGIGVDTEQEVDAFHCAFHFGHALNVEALPGVDIREERTEVGTFWRDTAVEAEENAYFATGHPLVEALFSFLRDGPYGRAAFRHLHRRRGGTEARGLECLFHLRPPEPEDTTPGARVPSRQLARFLDRWFIRVAVARGDDGAPVEALGLLETLESTGRGLKGAQLEAAFPGFDRFLEPGLDAAWESAAAVAMKRVAEAKKALAAEREETVARLALALPHRGLDDAAVRLRLDEERRWYDRLESTLDELSIDLDAISGFVIA